MASLFIKTLATLNIEAARALAREVEGEGRSAPPKELIEAAPKPVKNTSLRADAPKGEVRWTKMVHKQSGKEVSVPQNKGEVGSWGGPDGWSWKRVDQPHNWEAAKAKAAEDGRWWVCLEGGKLWGWSPPNVRPSSGEKSPETKELAETDPKPVSASPKEEAASSPGASALVEAAKKRKEEKAEKPKRPQKQVEDKKE